MCWICPAWLWTLPSIHFHNQNKSVCEHDRKSGNYIDVTLIQRTVHLNQFILFFGRGWSFILLCILFRKKSIVCLETAVSIFWKRASVENFGDKSLGSLESGSFKNLHVDSIEWLSRVLTAQCLISERNKCRELNGRARNVKFMQILNQLMVHRISQDFHSHNTRWSRKVFFCVDLKFLYCTIGFACPFFLV